MSKKATCDGYERQVKAKLLSVRVQSVLRPRPAHGGWANAGRIGTEASSRRCSARRARRGARYFSRRSATNQGGGHRRIRLPPAPNRHLPLPAPQDEELRPSGGVDAAGV